ncbi:hypothetical protein DXC31_18275, partial [Mediterraneibacter gnavus]
WEELEEVRRYFRKEKNKIWKTGTFKEEFYTYIKISGADTWLLSIDTDVIKVEVKKINKKTRS